MKNKLLVVGFVTMLLLSGLLVAVGGRATDEVREEQSVDKSIEEIEPKAVQEIYDWHDLNNTRENLAGDYVLMNDLGEDTTGYDEVVNTTYGWEPIGDQDYSNDVEFTGTFDGNGYEIKDLYIDRSSAELVGLFGCIEGGTVTDIGLIDANVSGRRYVGGVVGWNREEGTVNNSYVTGNVSGNGHVGAIVGCNWRGAIENSHYNIDEVLINGGHNITIGGLFDAQYLDWIEDKNLEIADYSDTLVPSGDYYEIDGTDGLRNLLGFAGEEEYKFRLTEDIDLSDEPGLYIPYLTAQFEGDNHTISNLYIDMPFADHVGMFGYVTSSGEIRNIGVVDVNVSGFYDVGGLGGYNWHGTVSNSYVTGNVGGREYVGGIMGFNHGLVENSYVTAKVDGVVYVGGLVGYNDGPVNNSFTIGDVNVFWYGGGLIGRNYGPVSNSYATGNVSGDGDYVGGLIGINSGPVKNSYAAGEVDGSGGVGGLVGSNGGTVSNSFWDEETSGINTSDGGTNKTTAEMKDIATFTDTTTEGLDSPWDFVGYPNDDAGDEEIWDIDQNGVFNDGYPFFNSGSSKLKIESITGDGTVTVDGEVITVPYEKYYEQEEDADLVADPGGGWYFANWEGIAEGEPDINLTMDEDKTITNVLFKEYGSINGTVTYDGTGLDDIEVNLYKGHDADTGQEADQTNTTDIEGFYEFDYVEGGNYTLEVTDPDYVDEERNTTVNPDQDVTEDFELDAEDGSVSGTVYDYDDTAYGGATVNLYEGDDLTQYPIRDATTGTDGGYEFTSLTAEDTEYTVEVTGVSGHLDDSTVVTLGLGEDVTDVDFNLDAEDGSIDGTVYDWESNPVDEFTATLYDDADLTEQNVTQDVTDGGYRFTDLTAGEEYWVEVTGVDGHHDASDSQVIDPGTAYTLDFNLDAEGGAIEGTVYVDDGTTEATEGTVSLYEGTDTGATPTENHDIGAEGATYSFDKLTAEDTTYTVEVTEVSGYVDVSGEVTLSPGEFATEDFNLAKEFVLTIGEPTGEGNISVENTEITGYPYTETFVEGDDVGLEAEATEGWYLEGWTGDVSEDEDSENIIIAMDGDKEITANFEELAAEFEVTNFTVDVDGLEATVTADVENVGNDVGTIELIVEGESIESLTLGAGENGSIEKTHEFEGGGEHKIELGDDSETAITEEEDEEYTPTNEQEFLSSYWWLILLIIIVAVVAIVLVMKRGRGKESIDEEQAEETVEFEDEYKSDVIEEE